MSDTEVSLWSKALLIKIHVITGWVIPDSESMMNILVEQFEKHLAESFGMLNTEEIEYAFRSLGTTIEDWGKNMNLNLTDKVLLKYVEKRFNASEAERKVKVAPPVQKIYTDDEILNMRRKDIEGAYQAMRKGVVPVIYEFFGEVLVDDGFIENRADLHEFFVWCLGNAVDHNYTKEPPCN